MIVIQLNWGNQFSDKPNVGVMVQIELYEHLGSSWNHWMLLMFTLLHLLPNQCTCDFRDDQPGTAEKDLENSSSGWFFGGFLGDLQTIHLNGIVHKPSNFGGSPIYGTPQMIVPQTASGALRSGFSSSHCRICSPVMMTNGQGRWNIEPETCQWFILPPSQYQMYWEGSLQCKMRDILGSTGNLRRKWWFWWWHNPKECPTCCEWFEQYASMIFNVYVLVRW